MPQSLHVLATHIVFSTKERRPSLKPNVRPRIWAYIAAVLRNLECDRVIVGGAEDHVHILCNLTKKHAPMKVIEIVKKDSSKFVKTLDDKLSAFHWQDGYGLFSVSPSHWQAVEKYISNQEEHHRKETFQEELRRILDKYGAKYDEHYLWD